MAKIIFEDAEIVRVEWVKNSTNGNPQYRVTFNSYSGHKDDLIRSSWSMLTVANAGWAWAIEELRYNNGEPKRARLEVSKTEKMDRVIDFTEIRG